MDAPQTPPPAEPAAAQSPPAETAAAEPAAVDAVRRITDAKVLTAMSHPLRRRLLDLLKVDGPATASRLAEATGEAVGNISHHLRALAAAGLVAEAPELARDRRERWWRRSADAFRWASADFAGDPAAEAVAAATESLNLDQQVAHIRAWAAQPPEVRAAWPLGPFSTDSWLRLTDAELAQFAEEVVAVVTRWAGREIPDDGAERATVFAFARAVPARP